MLPFPPALLPPHDGRCKTVSRDLYGVKLRSRHSRMRHEDKQTMEEQEAMVYLLLGLWFFDTGRLKAEQQKARVDRRKRLREARKNTRKKYSGRRWPPISGRSSIDVTGSTGLCLLGTWAEQVLK